MSYQRERGECIAQLTKHGLPYPVIETLLRCATSINRYAELACSSEAADRDRIKCPAWTKYGRATYKMPPDAKTPCLCDVELQPFGENGDPIEVHSKIPRITLQDWRAEQRAIKAIAQANKDLDALDPCGCCGAQHPPGYGGECRDNAYRFDPDARWRVITSGDPRGYTLRVVPPAYAKENKTRQEHDPRAIGIPPGPSRLRF